MGDFPDRSGDVPAINLGQMNQRVHTLRCDHDSQPSLVRPCRLDPNCLCNLCAIAARKRKPCRHLGQRSLDFICEFGGRTEASTKSARRVPRSAFDERAVGGGSVTRLEKEQDRDTETRRLIEFFFDDALSARSQATDSMADDAHHDITGSDRVQACVAGCFRSRWECFEVYRLEAGPFDSGDRRLTKLDKAIADGTDERSRSDHRAYRTLRRLGEWHRGHWTGRVGRLVRSASFTSSSVITGSMHSWPQSEHW